jgi:cellulose synthase/poly-beta-1,6-N-acetylglucosamine synthase-like glycosyltransferase
MSRDPMTVSIIIPARNEAAHLPALLTSLARLDYSKGSMEIILVDHESTDDTPRLAREAGAKVVAHHGGTISSVRNRGAQVATGDVLAFLDADCTVDGAWLTTALCHFADPQVGAVGSYHVVPLDPPTWVRQVLQKQIEARPQLSEPNWLPSGNMFVRRDAFMQCGGFDESMATCEDVDLSYRLAQRYRLVADARIRCWHHGEPRTLWEVFRKELWRGRDNLIGAFRHGIRVSEIPSLVLPMYFTGALLCLLATPVVWTAKSSWVAWWLLGSSLALFGPICLLSGLLSMRSGTARFFFQFAAYFLTYFLARGIGPAYAWRNI